MKYGFTSQKCPKCGGNIYLDSDYWGWYEQCLQCSHTSYLETMVEVREPVSRKGNLEQAEGGVQLTQENARIGESPIITKSTL